MRALLFIAAILFVLLAMFTPPSDGMREVAEMLEDMGVW